ncbi:hypothetical protein [Polaromonas sp.]|uniref:hypothetical protein n=1 Tax=Polaromonas sp. TaxID=1869339 RepID=UPI0032646761
MQLHKTDRARAELQPGTRTLGQRERTLLLLADGSRSAQDLRPLFNGDGEKIALQLLREGFLHIPSVGSPGPASGSTQPPKAGRQLQASKVSSATAPISADQFDGKRSLATTRMFLFDICERMFSQRHPDLAERFRESLRSARDREAMLIASRDMIGAIGEIAGHERADSISERIAMLLPAEGAA